METLIYKVGIVSLVCMVLFFAYEVNEAEKKTLKIQQAIKEEGKSVGIKNYPIDRNPYQESMHPREFNLWNEGYLRGQELYYQN